MGFIKVFDSIPTTKKMNRNAVELFQDEAFETIRDYLEEHQGWDDLEGDELAEFKRTMLDLFKDRDRFLKFQTNAECIRMVGGDCEKLCWVIDEVIEQIWGDFECYDVTMIFNTYFEFILETTIDDNWEGILLNWENYTRPFSDEEDEESPQNNP